MYDDLFKLRFPGFTTCSISELPSFDAIGNVHCNIGGQVKLSFLGLLRITTQPGLLAYLPTIPPRHPELSALPAHNIYG